MSAFGKALLGLTAAQNPTKENVAAFQKDNGKHKGLARLAKAGGIALMGGAAGAGLSSAFSASAGGTNVIDISPDLLEGGEGTNIFVSEPDPSAFTGGWTTNPTISDLEMGGEGAGLPGMSANAANFPTLEQITKGAGTAISLYRANEVGRAQVAAARNPTPSTILPDRAAFRNNPGSGGYFSGLRLNPETGDVTGDYGSSKGFLSNTPTLVIGAIVAFILAILFLKR